MNKLFGVIMALFISFASISYAKPAEAFVGPTISGCAKVCPVVISAGHKAIIVVVHGQRIKSLYGGAKILKMYKNGQNLIKIREGVKLTIMRKRAANLDWSKDAMYLNSLEKAIAILY